MSTQILDRNTTDCTGARCTHRCIVSIDEGRQESGRDLVVQIFLRHMRIEHRIKRELPFPNSYLRRCSIHDALSSVRQLLGSQGAYSNTDSDLTGRHGAGRWIDVDADVDVDVSTIVLLNSVGANSISSHK